MPTDFILKLIPEVIEIDDNPPSIADRTISFSSVTQTSFTVSFTKATDDTSEQEALNYKLYISDTNNLSGTPSNVEANGTLEAEGVDVSSFNVSGLSQTTTYYVNVIVTDEEGNRAIYSQNSVTTDEYIDVGDGNSREDDEVALMNLYAQAGGGGWTNNSGWSSTNMSLSSNIYGVTTQTVGGQLRVTRIDLRDNSLSNNIEVPALANLKRCKYFNVHFNDLRGNLPNSLGGMQDVEYLYLNLSDKSGTHGKTIDPHEDALTGGGDIHTGKSPAEGKANHNIFYGSIPSTIGNLSNLKWFTADWCELDELPLEMFNCTNLEGLHVAHNPFNDIYFGTGFHNLDNLTHLAIINGNDSRSVGGLNGQWDDIFGPGILPSLHSIRIGSNQRIRGEMGEPSSTNIRNFLVGRCWIEGPFPTSLVDGSKDLVSFLASWPVGGGWSGTLPYFGPGMQDFTTFNVAGHSFEGEIPAEFFHNNPGMIVHNFRDNNFTSVGTTDLSMLWRPRGLRWQNNSISGKWPNLDWDDPNKLDDLQYMEFGGNNYTSSDYNYVPEGQSKTVFELYNELPLDHFWY